MATAWSTGSPLRACEVRALAERGPRRVDLGASPFRALLKDGSEHGGPERVAQSARRFRPCPFDLETRSDDELRATAGLRRPKPLRDQRPDEPAAALEPFSLPSPILPPAATIAGERNVGSGLERAALAALAERLVIAMRVGRVGRDGHLVQLRLRAASGQDVEVRIRHEDGRIAIVLGADAGALPTVARLERALRGELTRRGLAVDTIEFERT